MHEVFLARCFFYGSGAVTQTGLLAGPSDLSPWSPGVHLGSLCLCSCLTGWIHWGSLVSPTPVRGSRGPLLQAWSAHWGSQDSESSLGPGLESCGRLCLRGTGSLGHISLTSHLAGLRFWVCNICFLCRPLPAGIWCLPSPQGTLPSLILLFCRPLLHHRGAHGLLPSSVACFS